MKKEWKELCKRAKQQGWRIEHTCNGHTKWLSPNGADIVVSGNTVSDRRGIKNHVAMLRRAGFDG